MQYLLKIRVVPNPKAMSPNLCERRGDLDSDQSERILSSKSAALRELLRYERKESLLVIMETKKEDCVRYLGHVKAAFYVTSI